MSPQRMEAILEAGADGAVPVDNPYAMPSAHRLEQLRLRQERLTVGVSPSDLPSPRPVGDPTRWSPSHRKLARAVTDYAPHERRFPPPPAPDPIPAADPLAYRHPPIGKQVTKRWLKETQACPDIHDHGCPHLLPQQRVSIPHSRWASASPTPPSPPLPLPDPTPDLHDRLSALRHWDPSQFLITSVPLWRPPG
eukprot:TRINITY_DN530_c1_g1_i1.p1 TRINITY_DN530_c1_g1~~TRINITY_DN530_c1_g1_i1.p1  ORF type:complete len:194 (-),score=19.03 TRINITY_DN530_c1_g1_i1:130-711(-)